MANPGLIGSAVALTTFYLLIAFVGIFSTIYFKRKFRLNTTTTTSTTTETPAEEGEEEEYAKNSNDNNSSNTRIFGTLAANHNNKQVTRDLEFQLIAGRRLGSCVGWLTMSATVVGGGFLNGTAEMVASSGLLWTLPPFGICFGLIIGGLVFAPAMRRKQYCTMLDPFDVKYGTVVTSLIYLSCLFGDILWSAAILAALGTTLHVIMGWNVAVAVLASTAVAVLYTLFGQMISVAYTDILELFFLTVGLAIVTPFVMTHESVKPMLERSLSSNSSVPWLGHIPTSTIALWVDLLIAMTLGSIPWQSYMQRVLSMASVRDATTLSVLGGLSALPLALPPICLGIVGSTVDWASTGLNETVYSDRSLTLPLVIKQFTSPAVSAIGLGAIAAAVMSSTDSAILGSSSMFTHNVYRKLRPHASSLELSVVLKISILLVGAASAAVALLSPSFTIAGLFILAADIVYVAVLPQLICSLFIPVSNGYGALIGYLMSLILRLCAGEETIGIPPTIQYPGYDAAMGGQLFPFRTFTMLCSLAVTVLVSLLAHAIVSRLPKRYDVLGCMHSVYELHDESINERLDGDKETQLQEFVSTR